MPRVVVAGAGLGALRTAESLRANGFSGAITVIGDEPHFPYNRPPLSKEALASGIDVAALEFRRRASVGDVEWRLGVTVVAADLSARTLTADDGSEIPFDGLVVATGIRSRTLPLDGPAVGRLHLRTAADAQALRPHLEAGARVVVIGSGFIGCEVAATARTLGCEVDVVTLDTEPLINPLGSELATGMRHRHEDHGVRFFREQRIVRLTGDARIEAVVVADGTELPADVVVEAVGSIPNIGWLEGNGLDLSDGVLVDSTMRVVGTDAPVVAVGDVARHPNALFPGPARRIEHWAIPTDTGRRAGATLAAILSGAAPDPSPYAVLPSFWSDQFAHQIQSFGMPGIATSVEIVDGDADTPCIATYHDDSGLVGVVGIDRTADLVPYRSALMARAEARP